MNNKHTQSNTIFNNKAIHDLREIHMTAEEKKTMLESIIRSSVPLPVSRGAVKSPWTIYSFSVWISRNRWSYAVIAVLIVSLAGGSVALAAEGSLPGDALYPVKVDVTEPLRVALAPSVEAKAKLAADFADKRVQEGETLAAEGKLDPTKQTELSNLITEHTQALNTALTAVASSDPQVAEHISVDFQERMDEHARHLDALVGTTTGDALVIAAGSSTVAVIAIAAHSDIARDKEPSASAASFSSPAAGIAARDIRNKDVREASRIVLKPTIVPAPAAVSATTSASASSSDDSAKSPHESGRSFNRPSSQLSSQEAVPILNLAASARASGNGVSSWNKHADVQSNDNQKSNDANPINRAIRQGGDNTAAAGDANAGNAGRQRNNDAKGRH